MGLPEEGGGTQQELFQRCCTKAILQNGKEGGTLEEGVEMFERGLLAGRSPLAAKDGRSLRQRALKMSRGQWSFTAGLLLVMVSRGGAWLHRVHEASK